MCFHAVSTTVHSPLLGLTRLKAVSNLPGDYKALKYYASVAHTLKTKEAKVHAGLPE